MRSEIGVVQVVVDLFAEPTVLGLVQDEIPELSLVDGNDLGEIALGRLLPLQFLKKLCKHGVVDGAFEVLTAIVKSLVCDTIERERGAIVGAFRHLGFPVGDDLLKVLDEGSLAVPGITGEDHEFRLGVENAGNEIAVELRFDIGFGVVAARATRAALALTIDSQEVVDVGIDGHFRSPYGRVLPTHFRAPR